MRTPARIYVVVHYTLFIYGFEVLIFIEPYFSVAILGFLNRCFNILIIPTVTPP